MGSVLEAPIHRDSNVMADSSMSIYHDVEKEDGGNNVNLFKNNNTPPSESSEAYTFMSAPKFGGCVTSSERGSITQSFKSPNFKFENPRNQKNDSGNDSLLDMAIEPYEKHDF